LGTLFYADAACLYVDSFSGLDHKNKLIM